MGLTIKFVNHNSVLEEHRKHITLHKDYQIHGDTTNTITDPDGTSYAIGHIKDDNDDHFMFLHRRKFNGTVITSTGYSHYDDVIKQWGHYEDISLKPRNEFTRYLTELLYNTGDFSLDILCQRVDLHHPFMSELKPGNMAITVSRDKFEAGKETSMTIGRAIKTIAPELSDAQLEQVVDRIRARYSKKDYTLCEGITDSMFKHAYSHEIEEMQNPQTTWGRKSLANSCMRYKFDQFDWHPAEAYASGDFKIFWVQNQHGQIAARSVMYTKNSTYGPIYGTTEQAMDMLANHFASIEATEAQHNDWMGARLQRLVHQHGEYIAPYIDVGNDGLEDDGDYLVFVDYGNIGTGDHQGILYESGNCHCEYCEDRMDEEYSIYTETHGTICESCYDSDFFRCEQSGEVYHIDYAERVYRRNSWGLDYDLVHSDEVSCGCSVVYIECRDEYWWDDEVFYSEDSEEYFTSYELDNGEFVNFDGEYYHQHSETLAELQAEEEAA